MTRMRALILCVLALGACDESHGFSRSANVARVPAPDSVLAIIRSTPGVDSAQYEVRTSGSDTIPTFTYEGRSGAAGFIQFFRGAHGIEFIQYRQQFGSVSAQALQQQMKVTLPVMRSIEARLRTRLGLTGLDSVTQRCYGGAPC